MVSQIKTSVSRHKNLLALLFFVLLAIIAIGANPLAEETTGPFDLLVSYSGYSSVAPSGLQVRCRERSDVLDARLPGWRKHKQEFYQCLENFKAKKLALIENLYEMIWKPGMLIYTCIPNDPAAFYFSQLIKLIIAGFGTYLLLRLFLSFPASLFGGMVYMLCGFHAAWFFWPQVDTSMWIPWLLWAVALYLTKNKTRYLFLVTLMSVFLIKGAFPAVAAYGFYAAALLIFIYNVFNRKNVRSFFLKSLLPLLFIGLGFMISSDYLFKIINITKTVDLSYRAYGDTTLNINKISNLFIPKDFYVESAVYSGFLAFVFSLLSFFYFWTKEKSKNWKSFYMFSFLLLIFSVIITYGLISLDLIRKIPAFSSNPLRRMSVILGLSMALLSSFFIEFVYRLKNKSSKIFKLAVPVLIIIFLVQFADQKRYFNRFNGPTPSKYFYPMTPSIKFVKKNIEDYQSIIADHSFNIAGTLSSYSFFEWYGHSFKTNEQRKLLSSLAPHSYSSPTSYLILGKNIDYSSPLMDLLAVRYILINPKFLIFARTPHFFKQPEKSHVPSPPLPFNTLCQHFQVSERRDLRAINLYVGNYKNERFDSNVLLKLYNSQTNELLGVSKKDKRYIQDNTWVCFEFEEPVTLKKGEYKFSLELANPKAPVMLSGWSTKRTKGVNSYLEVNGEETELSFKYFLHEANDIYKKNYKVHRLEPAVAVVENLTCPEGPYLISELDEYPPKIKISDLEYKSSVGEVKIHVPEGSSGYVVIPRPNHQYRAYVDGKKKPIRRYLDVMPAVYVEENSQVYIKEKLFVPLTGFLISFFSLLFFILLWFYLRKKKSLGKINSQF
ncbi:MAG: hypothetical protein ACOC5G_03155 [Acidobacteriota bacterium]